MYGEHPRRTFYFIFIISCDDFIIPLCLSFSKIVFFPLPLSLNILFFGFAISSFTLCDTELVHCLASLFRAVNGSNF